MEEIQIHLENSIELFNQIPEISLHETWQQLLENFPKQHPSTIYGAVMKSRNYFFAMAYDQMLGLKGLNQNRPYFPILLQMTQLSILKVRLSEHQLIYINMIGLCSGIGGTKEQKLGLAVALYRIRLYIYKKEQSYKSKQGPIPVTPKPSGTAKDISLYSMDLIQWIYFYYNSEVDVLVEKGGEEVIKDLLKMSSLLNKHLNICIKKIV